MENFQQTPFLVALGWALLHSVWQMSVLWMIYAGTIQWQSRVRPAYKHTAALVFLLAGFLWFCLTFSEQYAQAVSLQKWMLLFPHPSADVTPASGATMLWWKSWLEQAERTLPLVSLLYLCALVLLTIRFVRSWLHVQTLRQDGIIPMEESWQTFTRQVADQWRIPVPVQIYLSSRLDVPATLGFLKPVILLPVATLNHLSIAQTEAIILHELAHIKRHDFLVNMLVQCLETLFFFNPFVYLFSRQMKEQRELACDDWVIQWQLDSHTYASALLNLEKMRLNTPRLVMAATGGKKDLLVRVQRILRLQADAEKYSQRIMASLLSLVILTSLAWMAPQESPAKNRPKDELILPVETILSQALADPQENTKAGITPSIKTDAVLSRLNPKESMATIYPRDVTSRMDARVRGSRDEDIHTAPRFSSAYNFEYRMQEETQAGSTREQDEKSYTYSPKQPAIFSMTFDDTRFRWMQPRPGIPPTSPVLIPDQEPALLDVMALTEKKPHLSPEEIEQLRAYFEISTRLQTPEFRRLQAQMERYSSQQQKLAKAMQNSIQKILPMEESAWKEQEEQLARLARESDLLGVKMESTAREIETYYFPKEVVVLGKPRSASTASEIPANKTKSKSPASDKRKGTRVRVNTSSPEAPALRETRIESRVLVIDDI